MKLAPVRSSPLGRGTSAAWWRGLPASPAGAERFADQPFGDRVRVAKHVNGRHADHADAVRGQPGIAALVRAHLVEVTVACAVDLDAEAGALAVEVEDVRAERVLAPEDGTAGGARGRRRVQSRISGRVRRRRRSRAWLRVRMDWTGRATR